MAECMSPFAIKNQNKEYILVPCNKCENCLKRRVAAWTLRLQHEEKHSLSSNFLTLTYDTKYIPILRNGQLSLRRTDLQLFFKRLRKSHPKDHKTIKYYAVGEYGDQTERPHYHIIMFNADISLIQHSWGLGQIQYGDVSPASISYTVGYINKLKKIPVFDGDMREKEKAIMSKGLGQSYLTPEMVKWHRDAMTERLYAVIPGGKKVGLPRYYRDKIYSDIEREWLSQFVQRKIDMETEKIYDIVDVVNYDTGEIIQVKQLKDPMYFRNKSEQALTSLRKAQIKNTYSTSKRSAV